MSTLSLPALTASGVPLELTSETFGTLNSATDLNDPEALRAQMQRDGYLLLRDLLDHEQVLAARKFITDALAEEGFLDPTTPSIESIA